MTRERIAGHYHEEEKTMTGHELLESAQDTAKTFNEEFPSEAPSLAWLAEAASVERIADEHREEWEQAVGDALNALRTK